MHKKVIKPFWSYDVEKTEQWLNTMAAKGYCLSAVHTMTRKFSFYKGEPKQQSYRIIFAKDFTSHFSDSLKRAGWEHVLSERNWHFLVHKKGEEEITAFPSREGIITHNRKIQYVYSGILLYFFLNALIAATLLAVSLANEATMTFVPSPYWAITVLAGIIGLLLLGIAIYTVIKVPRTNRQLLGIMDNVDVDQQVIPEDELIKRRKWYWFDAPDRLVSWLEKMERRGYQLQRMSRQGLAFYFKKGKPRHISYFVDFQYFFNKSYFDMHQEAGWDLMFSSKSSFLKWSLWAQEYTEDTQKPQIYSDRPSRLKHAGKILFVNCLLSLPILFLIYLMITQNYFFHLQMSFFRWTILVIYLLGIIVFLWRIIRSVFYFLRVRRKSTI